jgi:hypothetical protein
LQDDREGESGGKEKNAKTDRSIVMSESNMAEGKVDDLMVVQNNNFELLSRGATAGHGYVPQPQLQQLNSDRSCSVILLESHLMEVMNPAAGPDHGLNDSIEHLNVTSDDSFRADMSNTILMLKQPSTNFSYNSTNEPV